MARLAVHPAKFSPVCCRSASCTISRSSGQGTRSDDAHPLLVSTRTLLVRAKEKRPLVREARQERNDLGVRPPRSSSCGGSKEEKFDHPTQKPVELMRKPILNHTKPGELVYDPFLGSGTTLAAAEVTKRVCYGLELDPRYADVVIERWQGLSGKKATLEGDGRTFEAIAKDRMKIAA